MIVVEEMRPMAFKWADPLDEVPPPELARVDWLAECLSHAVAYERVAQGRPGHLGNLSWRNPTTIERYRRAARLILDIIDDGGP